VSVGNDLLSKLSLRVDQIVQGKDERQNFVRHVTDRERVGAGGAQRLSSEVRAVKRP